MNTKQLSKKYVGVFTYEEVEESFKRIALNMQGNYFSNDTNMIIRLVAIELEAKKLAKQYHYTNWEDIEYNIYHYYPAFDILHLSYQAFWGRLKKVVKHLNYYCYQQRIYNPYKGD